MQRASPKRKPTTKHTGRWKRDGGESDEEHPKAKRQRKVQTQPKRSGVAHDGGQQFEVKMAGVIGLRGMARGDDFELSTNKSGYGNMDDLVYTTRAARYYQQLKHTDKPDTTKWVHYDLVPLLHQCFESYCNIIQGPNFKDIPVQSSQFIIYSNKQLGPKLLPHKRQKRGTDMILQTSDKGEIFSFTPDDNKKIDVYTQVENSVRETEEFRELSTEQQDSKLEMVREFLNKLIMVTGQKGQSKLDAVIIEEIIKHDAIKVIPKVYEAELLYFKKRLESWWRKKKEKMTPEILKDWLQEAKTESCASAVRNLSESSTKNFVRTGINFSDSEISWLKTELTDNRVVHLRSDALTLCSILMLDCLATSECIFITFESLQNNKNMLLHAWLGGHWEWLIVCCDATVALSDISDTCLEICENSKSDSSGKRVIILTSNSVQEIKDFVLIEHKFRFEQLSRKSQEIVLDKKIDLQGCEVTMNSLLNRHGNVQNVLRPELVTDLITEESPINIGGRLHINEDYYAPRVLERNIYLRLDILKDSHLRPYIYSLRNLELMNASELEPTGGDVPIFIFANDELYDVQDLPVEMILRKERHLKSAFCELCSTYSTKPLHWLEYKNGHLLWRKSSFGTDRLLDYIDAEKTHADTRIITEWMERGSCEVKEESIWDLNESRVLVVAEPGTGKSTTTTQVAWHTKQRDPTSWVLRVNWNDHTRKLEEIKVENFDFNSFVAFLYSASFPESKYTDFNMSLLIQALQKSGNITVLMDGFDEIFPTHAEKAAVILSELMKTEVGKVWVTSRPVERERLEKELSVSACSMKNLSTESQQGILRKIWISKASGRESKLDSFIHKLLLNVDLSIRDEYFTGSPLFIVMLATVYAMEMEKCLNSEDTIEPKIDLVHFYNNFVERKLQIYLREKGKVDMTNARVQDILEILKISLLENFEMCALSAIVPSELLKSLDDKKIGEKTERFLRDIYHGKHNTGIVINVVEGKPQFVHRTFAEYFTALWFSKNFELNRNVLEHILFDSKYEFVTDMFDRMLTSDYPLHRALLESNPERFETLLREGYDVNVPDNGGRTVMHLIPNRYIEFLNTLNEFSKNKISLEETDLVLQWTPLQYATKWENWSVVEWLLQRGVDKSGLGMIRAEDEDYIGDIVLDAASRGFLLLLEYLRSICGNIPQASSEDFPSPLHAAIGNLQVQVVKWLIQHGVDCNTRYSDGQTPLFYAVTEGSLDIVRALVEEGRASLDVCDDQGMTAIDWAEDYASDPQNRDAFWEDDVERLMEIVKYLKKKRGCVA